MRRNSTVSERGLDIGEEGNGWIRNGKCYFRVDRGGIVGVKNCDLDAFFLCTGLTLAKLLSVISNTFPEGDEGRTQAIKLIHSHVPRNH